MEEVKRFFYIIILLVLLGLPFEALAQAYINGTISDRELGEPMPGVRISYVEHPGTMAVSDVNGHYRITARKGTLSFSIIGYEPYAVNIERVRSQRINVKLLTTDNAMKEVVVTEKKGKYTRKNNPAVDFVRRVIEAKDSNDLRRHDFLSYQKYEKTTLALNEF